ncbi:MAG: hypothetical protein NWE95_13265 [Candidatus Bathyarchaeota archaeon]|nr:hypothetical protein [Candidatus Bathyarchaeota archaeon]
MIEIIGVLSLITVLGFIVFFILLPKKYGPRYTSKLTCPQCKRNFYFHWVLGATLTSLCYGNKRRLRCPYCNELSTFEIASTRITMAKAKPNT